MVQDVPLSLLVAEKPSIIDAVGKEVTTIPDMVLCTNNSADVITEIDCRAVCEDV